ncbi:hypothetical protein [Nocardia carnea]|uniref:hypothetical protein n=1 Tax=Nocardia carnea TaxID=37328 RepID=UPI002454846B|nr:hypothetical protein [Nocardia carnea]
MGTEFELRFACTESCSGWEQLAKQAPANLRRAFETIRANPRSTASPERHHRLKGTLASGSWKGATMERWQYEVTGGGRIWYLIDDTRRTAWITYAGTGHPNTTE